MSLLCVSKTDPTVAVSSSHSIFHFSQQIIAQFKKVSVLINVHRHREVHSKLFSRVKKNMFDTAPFL